MEDNNQKKGHLIKCEYCGEMYQESREFCPFCHKDKEGKAHGYSPMTDKQARKVRIVVTIVSIIACVVIYFFFIRGV